MSPTGVEHRPRVKLLANVSIRRLTGGFIVATVGTYVLVVLAAKTAGSLGHLGNLAEFVACFVVAFAISTWRFNSRRPSFWLSLASSLWVVLRTV
jgi:hypothetical protein